MSMPGFSTRRRKAMFAIAGAMGAALPVQSQDREVCPAKLKGGHSAGPYRFEFQSWSWEEPDEYGGAQSGFAFCHCVRNNSPDRALFVDWEETKLRMFLAPKQAGWSYSTYPERKEIYRSVPLWYGAGPAKLEVPTAFNELGAPTGSQERPGDMRHLKTVVSMSLPDLIGVGSTLGVSPEQLTIARIASVVERSPSLLVPMKMAFESAPIYDEQVKAFTAVRNSCTYQVVDDRRAHRQLAYRMRFSREDLNKTVFRGDSAVIRGEWGGRPERFSGEDRATSAATTLGRSTATLEVMNLQGKLVLGSMPIAYYVVQA